MELKLYNHADGVDGHYCVGRLQDNGIYHEYWTGSGFSGFGRLYETKQAAEETINALKYFTSPPSEASEQKPVVTQSGKAEDGLNIDKFIYDNFTEEYKKQITFDFYLKNFSHHDEFVKRIAIRYSLLERSRAREEAIQECIEITDKMPMRDSYHNTEDLIKEFEKLKKMKNFLLIIFLCLLCYTANAQTQLFCKQYTMVDSGEYSTFTEPVCYRSVVRLQIKSDEEIILITDSLTLHFIVIYRQQRGNSQDLFLASILGQPGQIYSINRRIGDTGNFFLACVPIRLNDRFSKVEGVALEISNVEICK